MGSEYVDPGGAHDAVSTVEQLFEVLDDQDVNAAIKRIAGRAHFDLVTIEYYGPPEDAPDATEIDDGQPPSRGRKQDRARVAGGQDYEVRYEAKKTGRSKRP